MLVCNATSNSKKCNKKYKTQKGLQKHYDTVHKEQFEKHDPMSSFGSYLKNYVKEMVAPEYKPEESSDQPPQKPVPVNPSSSLETRLKLVEDQNKLLMSQNKIYSMKMDELFKRMRNLEKSNKKYCIVCWDNESNNAFIPCGHKIVCGTCAVSLLGGKRECPVCSQKVYDFIQVWDGGQPQSDEETE
jgi:hypothetical protein